MCCLLSPCESMTQHNKERLNEYVIENTQLKRFYNFQYYKSMDKGSQYNEIKYTVIALIDIQYKESNLKYNT